MKLNLKLIALSLAFSTVGLADQAPLSGRVLGCMGKTESYNGSFYSEVLFIRNQGELIVPRRDPGLVYSIIFKKFENGIIFGNSALPYEGEKTLADGPYEKWTYPSPPHTVFTARGNYEGFFLLDRDKDYGRAIWVSKIGDLEVLDELICTTNFNTLAQWYNNLLKKGSSLDPRLLFNIYNSHPN